MWIKRLLRWMHALGRLHSLWIERLLCVTHRLLLRRMPTLGSLRSLWIKRWMAHRLLLRRMRALVRLHSLRRLLL